MSATSNFLSFLKGELEVTAIPVIVGALGVLQKNPNALGVAAAEAYFLGNAPAALVTGETALLQNSFQTLTATLQALQASGAAAIAAVPAKA